MIGTPLSVTLGIHLSSSKILYQNKVWFGYFAWGIACLRSLIQINSGIKYIQLIIHVYRLLNVQKMNAVSEQNCLRVIGSPLSISTNYVFNYVSIIHLPVYSSFFSLFLGHKHRLMELKRVVTK